MSTTTFDSNGAQRGTTIIRSTGLLLQTLTNYLVESVYGSLRLTVSERTHETARRLALAVVASYVQPMPLTFRIGRDLPMSIMLSTAYLLANNWSLETGSTCSECTLHLTSCELDQGIWRSGMQYVLPSRSEADCGYVRLRIKKVAQNIPQQASWQKLVTWLGRCAGSTFEFAVNSLINGGE